MHPQQVVKLGKYHHEQSTQEVCFGVDVKEEGEDGEGEVCERGRVGTRIGLRRRMFGWCYMCIFGVGAEDGDEGGGKGE